MKHLNLIYKLSGTEEKIETGLSVFDIAPILLSVGELIRKSNQILYPEGREIAVNVKPFRQGSFIIDIVIFAHNKFRDLISFVNQEEVEQVKTLLEWIGIICGTSASLCGLIRFLKGKPKTIEQLTPNEIRYTGEDNASITVPREVHQLFQNCNIQTIAYHALGKPLEQEGIVKVETYLENENNERVVFGLEEAQYLQNYSLAEIPSIDLEETVVSPMKVYLIPKRGSFDGDPRQWSFRMGETVITATIKDESFLKKCKEGDIRPNHTDILYVDLIQKIKKINGRFNTGSIVFEVEKVLDYQKCSTGAQASICNKNMTL